MSIELLDAYVKAQVRALGHPGVAVGVVLGDRVLFSHGFGVRNKRSRSAVTPETVFRIASITKVFSGVALLALRDAGALTLDDPITKLLPETTALRPAQDGDPPIALRHLVTHTSGLPRNVPNGGTSERAFLAKLRQVRATTPPGTHVAYSNLAMGLVGPIIARASGVPYRDYMRTKILAPLGMRSAVWEMRDVPREKLATGYERVKEGPKKDELEASKSEWQMGAAEAFGGLYVSLEDMEKFVSFELSAGEMGAESKAYASVLSRSSLRESQTVALAGTPEAQHFGVNWIVGTDDTYGPRIEHTGATDEYSSSVALLPAKDLGVIVLSNASSPADVEALAHRIVAKSAELLDN